MTVQASPSPGVFDPFPDTSISPSPDGSNPYQSGEVLHLDLSGTASDAQGVAAVRVVVNDLDTGTYLTSPGGATSTNTRVPAGERHHVMGAVGRPAVPG